MDLEVGKIYWLESPIAEFCRYVDYKVFKTRTGGTYSNPHESTYEGTSEGEVAYWVNGCRPEEVWVPKGTVDDNTNSFFKTLKEAHDTAVDRQITHLKQTIKSLEHNIRALEELKKVNI